MPRRPRSELTDGIFHATARGTGRIAIFKDALDADRFLQLLHFIRGRWSWRLHAFCLMPNHYHLVVAATVRDLSRGMHALNGRHARLFNKRHDRSGHLFQERFDARLVEEEDYLEHACRYVVENPVRAGLCGTTGEWRWGGLC